MNVSTQAQGAYRLIITITSIARGPKGPSQRCHKRFLRHRIVSDWWPASRNRARNRVLNRREDKASHINVGKMGSPQNLANVVAV